MLANIYSTSFEIFDEHTIICDYHNIFYRLLHAAINNSITITFAVILICSNSLNMVGLPAVAPILAALAFLSATGPRFTFAVSSKEPIQGCPAATFGYDDDTDCKLVSAAHSHQE